jgi:hypothetical protein
VTVLKGSHRQPRQGTTPGTGGVRTCGVGSLKDTHNRIDFKTGCADAEDGVAGVSSGGRRPQPRRIITARSHRQIPSPHTRVSYWPGSEVGTAAVTAATICREETRCTALREMTPQAPASQWRARWP